ncbi:ABC transporter ATP-binding protein [uncultured Robinsoniella sp.]|uniref:ABC transporter ATP-binding protein n=1 Tax=uncultured Robinsoniella sp. TaxID=904190 RepID=UPI00374E8D1D
MQTRKKKALGLGYLLALAGRRKSGLIVAVGCSVLSGLFTFVPYLMIFRTILLLFSETPNGSMLFTYGLIAAGAIIFRFTCHAVSLALTHVGAYHTLYEVRRQICDHLGKIHLGFFTDNSTGEVKKVLMEDVDRLEQFLAHQLPDIVVAVVVPVVVLCYLFTVNIWMSLALLATVILIVILMGVELSVSKKRMNRFYEIAGRQSAVIMQFIVGMPVMKTYNLTADSYRTYSDTVSDYQKAWWDAAKQVMPIASFITVLVESGLIVTLPLGGLLYLRGSLELAAYLFFLIMGMVFLTSYSNLMNFAQIFIQISAGITRIGQIMDVPEAHVGSRKLESSKSHSLTFNHVSFAYKNKEVLHDVSIDMPAGSLTAFVGVSGAGKSTAAQLIPRFWDVSDGAIKIDGYNLSDYSMEDLMDTVSFVFQDSFLLDDTIYANIAVGRPGCARIEVENAAQAAQIHDFICSLPQGYDTDLGSAGVKMSGGERQRVCIARAILKNAPIIVFDEATSFTDLENEHKIQLALNELLQGKTTIMIAHRLHTIIHADQICVFEEGEVMERGTHPELVAKNGRYAAMWRTYIEENSEVNIHA